MNPMLWRALCTGVLITLMTACSNGGGDDPKPCADTSRRVAMPSPLWGSGDTFAPPPGDRVLSILEDIRPAWAAQLSEIDGWPKLLTILVPLDQPASALDESGQSLVGRAAGETSYREIALPVQASLLDEGRMLLVKPDGPLPAWVAEAALVIAPSALGESVALGACAAEGGRHPAYDAAEAALPEGFQAELALPIILSKSEEALPVIWRRLVDQPALQVTQLEAKALADFGTKAPPPEVAVLLMPNAAQGLLALPDYRAQSGHASLAADGGLEAVGTTQPGIVVALPAAGQAPYPWVLFQHGGGQNKADFFQLAEELARAGFAIVGVDLPYHGDRASPGGGDDLDILDFDDLLHTRDNFRQAAADHMAILSGTTALNTALEQSLGVADALDPARVFYMGLSMGGIAGSLSFSACPNFDAAALFVGAAGFSEIVRHGVFSLFAQDLLNLPPLEMEVSLGMAEVLLDGADPHAYAQRAEDRSAPPRPALFFQAVDEAIISDPISDAWARAFGADLADPYHHSVSGMAELSLPAADNFAWEGSAQAVTRLLIQNPMAEQTRAERHGALITLDYSQQNVVACFSGVLAGGSCQVIDTAYNER
jgi:pimeloyl-ACP methyl ester carboxylesterase